ncbi:glycoside hydrolase family 79 protein [Zasmidium cellare ATCC 36951]|uniref:Glycoside hydrolase family 79 protein n=1 Tax=Zasmidium cellare ATCC 36951 TaxID=1080233 RepID=A0A6A6BWY9_ZASCE|nr:glycoside hydrolase family 79 protein [Zasmidium cellare ATCC 36951]KAF2159215.1 glycoside hydrolase family 79 protein [Zasmidium cellare ATCC 36951]
MIGLNSLVFLALVPSISLAQTTISIPSSGANAVQVSSSFVNTGFELSSLQFFVQTSPSDNSSNQYSINLLNALFGKSGGRPVLRVGGVTGDGYVFDMNLTQPIYPNPAAPSGQKGATRIGPSFWSLTKNLAAANPLWQPQVSYTNTTDTLTVQDGVSIVKSIGTSNIIAIEIGNEPNEYKGHTDPSAMNATFYSNRFQGLAANISQAAGINPTTPFFAGPDLASYDLQKTDWSIEDLFQNTSFDKTGNIKLATDHWYLSEGDTSIPDVMNHAKMISTSAPIATAAKFFQQYGKVDYVLDEFNVLNGGPNLAFSSSLGSALASVDFLLYAMTLGVKRIHFEQVYGSNQAIWIPCNNGSTVAQTHSGYYALITASEFIGGTSGNTKVQQITPGGGNDGSTFSAYVAYNGNTPNRVALLNLNYWDQSQNIARPQPTIQVSGIPSGLSSVNVEYLTNPGGAGQNADQTTFGGSQWPYSTLGVEKKGVQNTTIPVAVKGGVAQIPSPYSSVAIVYLS